uniref:protein MOS2-like n=1 Tax=Erigeron canadensis TaxID=72917 RepID=UPI001CB9002C|nr:protein MOS2-like [Erigeron canadensis]
MKLSFSLPPSSKSSSKPTISPSSNQQKEFITEFDQSKPTSNNNNNNQPIIIPPIPNQWNPETQIVSNIKTGLNIRDKKQTCGGPGSETLSEIDRLMLMKLKDDLKTLPDDKGLGEFDDVSVGEFGRAYLKGYGWYEGRGIGKNVVEDVKVFEFTKRTGSEGLGFDTSRKVGKLEKCGGK